MSSRPLRIVGRSASFLAIGLAAWSLSAGTTSASVPPDSTPDGESGEVIEVPVDGSTSSSEPVTTVPASCFVPTPVHATFVGEVVAYDRRTARFKVIQMRGGALDGYAVANLVDVSYADDVRFLDIEESYIVAVGVDENTGILYSKIRDPEPLYGGSQVVGLNAGVTCPEIEDAVRTLTMQGRSVESGVLAPLKTAKTRLGRAVLLPLLWVFGGLFGLACLRALVVAITRSGKRAWNGE